MIIFNWIFRKTYLNLFKFVFKRYNQNPFGISVVEPNEYYLNRHQKFLKINEEKIRHLYPTEIDDKILKFIQKLALHTQVTKKESDVNYVHGAVLYVQLRKYLENKDVPITIFETGTARGFSSVIMAKALSDEKKYGKILSLDLLSTNIPMVWNSYGDESIGERNRLEVLTPWKQLVDDYILFFAGDSAFTLKQVGISRIHFAFLDARHDHKSILEELYFTSQRQEKGDVIICDDYDAANFPGIITGINEFLLSSGYQAEVIEGIGSRSYCILVRN